MEAALGTTKDNLEKVTGQQKLYVYARNSVTRI